MTKMVKNSILLLSVSTLLSPIVALFPKAATEMAYSLIVLYGES